MDISDLDVPVEAYDKIRQAIESDESPVGIDAQKAHVIILYKLIELEERLDRLEERLNG